MERVLVGVDGSTASRHALRWAADVAGRAGLELLSVRVIEKAQADVPAAELASLRQRLLGELQEWCASLSWRCAHREVAVVEGDAPSALLEMAGRVRADLVVVGSRGAGQVAGLHFGSVARELARRTPVPLAVVAPAAVVTTSRLVIGHDLRTGNPASLALAAELARRLAVPVTAVYTTDPRAEGSLAADAGQWHRQAETAARSWAAPVEAAGVPVDVHVDQDRDVDPVAAIEYVLSRQPGSVAVIGVRGPGGHGAGRVPLRIGRHSRHAVVVVPAAARASNGSRRDVEHGAAAPVGGSRAAPG